MGIANEPLLLFLSHSLMIYDGYPRAIEANYPGRIVPDL